MLLVWFLHEGFIFSFLHFLYNICSISFSSFYVCETFCSRHLSDVSSIFYSYSVCETFCSRHLSDVSSIFYSYSVCETFCSRHLSDVTSIFTLPFFHFLSLRHILVFLAFKAENCFMKIPPVRSLVT